MPRETVVLLTEDEYLLRSMAAKALREEGFDVIEAVQAEDALAG